MISFAIAGLGCLFAGLCYSEYASMIPAAGSAYDLYLRHRWGRFVAWIIGWNLVLEYLATASTVAVGWSGYFNNLSDQRHMGMPHSGRNRLGAAGRPWLRRHELLTGYMDQPAGGSGWSGSSPMC